MENEFSYKNRTFKYIGFFADLLIFANGDSRVLLDKERNVFCEYTILNSPGFSNGVEINESVTSLGNRGEGK
jgi:hypothetical protein